MHLRHLGSRQTVDVLSDSSSPELVLRAVSAELRGQKSTPSYFDHQRSGYLDDLIRLQRLHRPGVLLEIGGFPFLFSLCLRWSGYEVKVVDLAPARARDFIQAHDLDVRQCDVEREPLPFRSDSISTVVLAATFEHLRIDPIFVLEEVARVLMPGGLLYLSTPNFYRLGNIGRFLLGRGLANNPLTEYRKLRTVGHMGHVREYTAAELHAFVEAAGFDRIDVVSRSVNRSRRGRFVDVLNATIPSLRPELVLTARKRGGFGATE